MSKLKQDKRLSRVLSHAALVFGSWDKAREWMGKGHHLLDGKTPNDVVASHEGATKVDKILSAIDYGVML